MTNTCASPLGPDQPCAQSQRKKYSWAQIDSYCENVDFSLRFNAYLDPQEIPPKAQIIESENRLFWSNCARAALSQYLRALQEEETSQALYFKRKFLGSMTNRRVMKHLRIINERNYKPIAKIFLMAESVVEKRECFLEQQDEVHTLLAPLNVWVKQFLGEDIDCMKLGLDNKAPLLDAYCSILIGLEKGLAGKPPTTVAQIVLEPIQEILTSQKTSSELHSDVSNAFHDLQKFLTPYLLDTRFFKKKHRLDALLN